MLAAAAAAALPGEAGAFVWPNVPDQIARALLSGDVADRRIAAARLGELPPEIALKLIQKAISDTDVEVRLRLSQAAIGFRMPKAGDLVVEWLSDSDARLRLAACDVIRAAPTDRSVVALGRVLGDPDPHVRLAAAAAMGSSAMSEAVSPLLGHLDDPAAEVRAEVARALGRIGDARAVVPLIGKVQDSTADVRKVVARALGDLGDLRAASALMLSIQDASAEVRLAAVEALGKLRADEATIAIAPLIEVSSAQEGLLSPTGRPLNEGAGVNEVRAAALRALGRIASEPSIKVLVGALAKDDPSTQRSPVREALIAAGKSAVPALVAALSSAPSQNTAAGAALVLGSLKAKEGLSAIIRGMQRGVVPLRQGLRALGSLGSPEALPTALELLGDVDPTVRKEAIRAASALLDPDKPDGRAVDPASAALVDPDTAADEKIALVQLLGRTGSPRAQGVLLPLLKARAQPIRLAALEALGAMKGASPEVEAALLRALDDESVDIRLRAAMSLATASGPGAAALLLSRLEISAEQDRGAIGVALSGALSRVSEPALAAKVGALISSAPDGARDALIEGLGRMKGPAAGAVLSQWITAGIDDRRKVAEALAGHPEEEASLSKLIADADPGVRASAAWSLGAVGKKSAITLLMPLLQDPDAAVAGNAAAAIGRVAAREGDASIARGPLCSAIADARPYIRANALAGLSLSGARCEPRVARDLLARDPAEAVRMAAAAHLARAIAEGGEKADPADRRSLARCAAEDKNASVALRCNKPITMPSGAEDISVFIVPDGREAPVPRAPFALARADGLLRLGTADRRGAIFEPGAPGGPIRLAVPAPLAR